MKSVLFICLCMVLFSKVQSEDDLKPIDNSNTGETKFYRLGHVEKVQMQMYDHLKTVRSTVKKHKDGMKMLTESEEKMRKTNAEHKKTIKKLEADLKQMKKEFAEFQEKIQGIHPSIRK